MGDVSIYINVVGFSVLSLLVEDENGLHCLLARRLAEVEEQHQMVLQRYKTALGPFASVLLDVCEEEECDPMGLISPDTSEDEEDAREHVT